MMLRTDIQFRSVPVPFQETLGALAKIFYTREVLGTEDRSSLDLFVAIHRKKTDLTQGNVNRAKSSAQAYGVDQVPELPC